MARRGKSGPLQITIDEEQFSRALKSWPDTARRRSIEILDEAEKMIIQSLQQKTPVLTGRARASWTKIRFNYFSRAGVSFLNYIRRLEVGRRKKARRPGQKLPAGGYRMVRNTQKEIPTIIQVAAARILSRNK